VNVSVLTRVSPAASVVVYLYTVGWFGSVGGGIPTGPCCTFGIVAGGAVDVDDAEVEDEDRGIVRMIDVVVAPASGFTVMTSTTVCPN